MYHKIIVIHATDRDSANEFCNSIGAQGETFTVGLYDDLEQLAGYWCGWNMTDEQLAEVEAYFEWVFDTQAEALAACGWHLQVAPPQEEAPIDAD